LLFNIYIVEDQTVVKEYLIPVSSQPSESLPLWLAKKGVTDVITNKIGSNDINLFNKNKINVFVGVKLDTPGDLVHEYIDMTLETQDILIIK
jgi:predicted Fe-Mo cluster-binding NifX family protein